MLWENIPSLAIGLTLEEKIEGTGLLCTLLILYLNSPRGLTFLTLTFCLGQIPLFRVPLALGAAPQIASGLSMLCCNGPGTFLCAVEIVSVLFS